MSAAIDVTVRDARPPALVVRLTNVIMTRLLRTRVGRVLKPLALLEFEGRRSAQVRRVVVGWHTTATTAVVLTPAPWRANFAHGHSATVFWNGRRNIMIGTLDIDPVAVAATVNALLEAGTPARSLALRIPPGHRIEPDDITRTNRAAIRFGTHPHVIAER
jgi:hypothetical protein